MLRELSIEIYLFVFRIVFSIGKRFPLKRRALFITSFGYNTEYVAREILKSTKESIIILNTGTLEQSFLSKDQQKRIVVKRFTPTRPIQWLHSIGLLATSSTVYVDNYYGFLAVTNFKKNVRCVQLWHAAGAIKQFGLKDPSNQYRTRRALERFQTVYHRFTDVVAGSREMENIFSEAFGLDGSRMLPTGVPRTDFFYDDVALAQAKQTVYETYPELADKKVILYAPTYRDDALNTDVGTADSPINLDILEKELGSDYIFLLKLHPAVSAKWQVYSNDVVMDVSDYPNVNELLVVADVLISDYSSIPFEYAILERPMIFFPYDLASYTEMRGFWEPYEQLIPGPLVQTTEELIEAIKHKEMDLEQIRQFRMKWNEYSIGNSSEKLVSRMHKVK